MSRKMLLFFAVALAAYLIYHLATLSFSPLPWFDEVTFVSMTESYMKDHTLYENVRIIAEPAQKLSYGPLYFIWQGVMIKAFGITIFNIRITNMLFGFLCLFLIYKICKQLKFRTEAAMGAVVLTALEPNFNQFLHSGRMDFISVSFFLLAYSLFISINTNSKIKGYILAAMSGILLGAAILTTPRIIFAFPVFVCYLVYEFFTVAGRERLQVFVKYAIVGVAFGVVYYIWIYTTFGSIANYIYYNTHAAYLKDHVGIGSDFRIRYNLFIYLFAFGLFFLLLKDRKVKANANLLLLTIPAITSFIVVVTGGIAGRYFAMIMPFIGILIAGVAFQLYEGKVLRYVTVIMALGFGAIFTFKAAYILATIPQHDPIANEKIVTQYIEPNSSVFGDFEFFYIARNKNCSFLTTQMNGSPREIGKYLLEHKIRYVIINKTNWVKPEYETMFLNEHYELIANVEDKNYSNFFSRIINKLPYRISDSYSCFIYRLKG